MNPGDINLEIRTRILRVNANLTVSQTDRMIADIATCYFDILADDKAHGETVWTDFFNFCILDGVVLAVVYRKDSLEIWIFSGEESFIEATNNLAMTDVDDFVEIVQTRAGKTFESLTIPMTKAEPWMEGLHTDE